MMKQTESLIAARLLVRTVCKGGLTLFNCELWRKQLFSCPPDPHTLLV